MSVWKFGARTGAAFAGLALAGGTALATQTGQADPWQMGLQEAATPVAESVHSFHNMLLVLITGITLLVLGLLIYVLVRFNAKANPVPSKTTHNTLVEVIWTIVPILILVVVAIPSFRLLYFQRTIPAADMTIKVIGLPSWQWTYEYPDLGLNEDKSPRIAFTAALKPEAKALSDNQPYLLAATMPVVVPVNKTVKLIVTADPVGISHSWTIPSFSMKIDAMPGRLNEDWFRATKEGIYYGQCSELCGKDHAYMPIEVWVVSQDRYDTWVKAVLATEPAAGAGDERTPMERANDALFQQIKPAKQVAQN